MTRPEYAIVGLIRKAQGIRGEVVVEPLTDKPDVVFASGNRVFAGDAEGDLLRPRPGEGDSPQTLTIESTKPFKGGLIVQFAELRDRNGAELWRGRHVLAPFAELPPPGEDEIYLHDLIGMKAERSTGEQIGAVTAYYELPQGIMLDVETATGSVLIPYRPEIVRSADVANRILVIDDTLGFLE